MLGFANYQAIAKSKHDFKNAWAAGNAQCGCPSETTRVLALITEMPLAKKPLSFWRKVYILKTIEMAIQHNKRARVFLAYRE